VFIQQVPNIPWIRQRFNATGIIKADTALSSLPRGADNKAIEDMIKTIGKERTRVRLIIKDEVEILMSLGANITKMTYMDRSTMTRRTCVTAKDIRESYVQEDGMFNIKCVHWIFNEFPFRTHPDVLTHQQNHMDLVVAKVERIMGITWAPRKKGETSNHRNCLEHMYSKVLGKTLFYWKSNAEGEHLVSWEQWWVRGIP
jgi:hypothetical protein